MADVDSLILKDVVNRDVLTAYHNHMKSYVDKNTNDIIAINADNTGILAQSKRYTDSKAKELIDETLNTSFSICSISAIDALFPDE